LACLLLECAEKTRPAPEKMDQLPSPDCEVTGSAVASLFSLRVDRGAEIPASHPLKAVIPEGWRIRALDRLNPPSVTFKPRKGRALGAARATACCASLLQAFATGFDRSGCFWSSSTTTCYFAISLVLGPEPG